jgi:hypothetical protein
MHDKSSNKMYTNCTQETAYKGRGIGINFRLSDIYRCLYIGKGVIGNAYCGILTL